MFIIFSSDHHLRKNPFISDWAKIYRVLCATNETRRAGCGWDNANGGRGGEEICHTVTVDGAFEVLRVPSVLSTPKVESYMWQVISIENKIEPREILEKNEFYWANPQNCYFSLLWCTRLTFSSLLTAPNGLRSNARWLFFDEFNKEQFLFYGLCPTIG